jgi:hypothetical protein
MKKYIITIGLCFQLINVFGQNDSDSLELWTFDFEVYRQPDKTKSVGKISFWRTKAIDDGISQRVSGERWTPNISYNIFNLSDSVYCLSLSDRAKMFSSCLGANVGGDLFRVGNYLFLNRNVCVSCVRYDTKIDYCRPVIKQIMSKVDANGKTDLKAIATQIPIKGNVGVKANK